MNTRISLLRSLGLARVFRPLLALAVSAGLFASAASFSGCATVAEAGSDTISYVRGDLRVTMPHSLRQVHAASQKAMQSLRLSMVSEAGDAVSSEFVARTAQDKRVVVRLNRVNDDSTELVIRVGLVGDKTLSNAVYHEIYRALQ